jgi:calcineurin-like phosphoesterase family protein
VNNTWFISDHHIGHKNILEYEKEHRPFSTIEEMRETIIERHNAAVKSNDIVYFLGDFAFGKHNIAHAGRFNGKKRLVLGNHDIYPTANYLEYFDKVYGVLFWKMCILSHMPVHPNGLGSRAFLNVHGHLHSRKVGRDGYVGQGDNCRPEFIEDRNYYNVSCEQNNLTPFHADEILERLKEIE